MLKKLKYLFAIVIIGILFYSCVTQKACDKKYPPQVIYKEVIKHDSIFTQLIVRDTVFDTIVGTDTVYVKSDTVLIYKGLVNSKPVTIKGEYADATAQVINSKLNVKLEERSKHLQILLKGAIREKLIYKTYYEVSKQKELITKKAKTPKFFIYWFIGSLVFIIGKLAWKYKGLLLKL